MKISLPTSVLLLHNLGKQRTMLALRNYQKKIVEDVGGSNAIIKMPTGSGKTFTAAEIIRRRLGKATYKKALMLVPTVDLVDQQARAIESWFGEDIAARYHGGLSPPTLEFHRVLVSTPAAFLTLMSREMRFAWDMFCICCFDEVHHVLKDHPYRKIAFALKEYLNNNPSAIQVVGLSASLTYAVNDSRIEKALHNLCYDLCISKLCSPSENDLIAGGYRPQRGNIEIIDQHDRPEEVIDELSRPPHKMYEIFRKRISEEASTPFALLMWNTVRALEDCAQAVFLGFSSPLDNHKLSSWEDYAHKLSVRPDLVWCRDFFEQLESFYVAIKLLVVSWEEEVPLTLQWLSAQDALKVRPFFTHEVHNLFQEINALQSNSSNRAKLHVLRSQLIEKQERFGESFRCIIFVQQRIGAYIIHNYINTDPELRAIGLNSGYITGVGKVTPSIKVTSSQTKEELDRFRSGHVNILVATATAEEGIDVPAANCVISYNHMKDSVELCQREGRARQQDRVFVILEQRSDRPVDKLRGVQQRQDTLISSFSPQSMRNQERQEKEAQMQRERSALRIFDSFSQNPMSVLNTYVQKTKGHLQVLEKELGGTFTSTLEFKTTTRFLTARGSGRSKKEAKKNATIALLHQIKTSVV